MFIFIKLNNLLRSVQILPQNPHTHFWYTEPPKDYKTPTIQCFYLCIYLFVATMMNEMESKIYSKGAQKTFRKKKTLTVTLWRLRTEEIITYKYLGHAFHLSHKSKPTDSPWNEIDQITFWGDNKSSLTSSSLAVKMNIQKKDNNITTRLLTAVWAWITPS